MKPVKAFKRNILKLCKEHGFDIEREGEMTIGQAEYDNGSALMPLLVQRANQCFIRVAHYYSQNGDMMADPEVWFWVAPNGDWYPQEFRQDGLGMRQELISGEWDGAEWKPKGYRTHRQHSYARFCTTWGRNIAWQQADSSATVSYYHEDIEYEKWPEWQRTIQSILRLAKYAKNV